MKRQLPKNVRQIGNVSDTSKIYVEDYVDTFFNQLCEKAGQEMLGAFLVGETVQEEEQDYIYIYGAIRMKELSLKGKEFRIEEHVWKNACETCKEYFGNAEILGWFVAGGEKPLEITHNLKKLHQKFFPREKSVFVTKNSRDMEEKFYIYKYRDLMECNGHYVYYEKNQEMQNYMIASRKKTGFTPSEIIEDRVTKSFRSLIREKEQKNEQKNHSKMVYALSTFLVLVILIVGVTMINNYERMKDVQHSLNGKEEEESVEALGGIVTPSDQEGLEQTDDTKQPSEEPQEQEPQEEEPQEQEPQEEIPQENEPQEGELQTPQNEGSTNENVEATQPEAYIVEKGDTLESISREKYGNTAYVSKICELNGLNDGNLIFIGQKLLLP